MEASGRIYVLVHGAFHGAWCWKEVATRLRTMGHVVYTPTLTGLGERSHLLACRPTLETFIEDVAQVFRYEELTDVVLVGHSFSGPVITAIADRMPERLRHLVYLDAMVLQSGQSAVDTAPPALIAGYRDRAAASGGLSVPPNEPGYYSITDPQQAEWLRGKLTPHPFQTYFDRLTLQHPLGNGVKVTYLACTQPPHAATASSRVLAQAMPGWTYRGIPTAHNAMLLWPLGLTQLLDTLGQDAACDAASGKDAAPC